MITPQPALLVFEGFLTTVFSKNEMVSHYALFRHGGPLYGKSGLLSECLGVHTRGALP